MNYAFLTNLPTSTKFPAHSVDVDKAIPADAARRGLTVLLMSTAATEFLLVAVAAYFATVLYHRLILLYSPDPAKYIPESLLIAILDLLVSNRAPAIFPDSIRARQAFLWSGVNGVFLVFFLSTMFVLKVSEDYSRVRPRRCQVCHSHRRPGSPLAFFRSRDGQRDSLDPLARLSDGSSVPAPLGAVYGALVV